MTDLGSWANNVGIESAETSSGEKDTEERGAKKSDGVSLPHQSSQAEPDSRKTTSPPLLLPSSTLVLRRLESIQHFPITIDPSISDVAIARRLLSAHFGGFTQSVFVSPRREKIEEHGYRHFLYLNLQYNPFVPTDAGKSGLFFYVKEEDNHMKNGGDERVLFVRQDSCQWKYLGLYHMEPAPCLTISEWNNLPDYVSSGYHNCSTLLSCFLCFYTWKCRLRCPHDNYRSKIIG